MLELSDDIWSDVADCLCLEQRHQLMLANRHICQTIGHRMDNRHWLTEEQCANAGDFCFGPTNLLFYRANLIKLLGRQNLFLKVRMRIVEDIAVSRLGRGDAILLGVEYMPIAHQQQYNEENNNDIGVVTNGTIASFWQLMSARIFNWISNTHSSANNTDNKSKTASLQGRVKQLCQYERNVLVKSTTGHLMWTQMHRFQVVGHTFKLKCRLKPVDSRIDASSLCMLPNVQASAAAYGNCVGGNTLPNVQDCFTFELSRSAAHCWPKYANFETAVEALGRNSFAMLDEQTLDIDNGNTICQLGEDLEFLIKPSHYHLKYHMDIFGEKLLFKIYLSDYAWPNSVIKIFCSDRRIIIYASTPFIEFHGKWYRCADYFNRIIELAEEIEPNSLIWQWSSCKRYIIIELNRMQH